MTDNIPPSGQALQEALALSEEALRNVELSEIPLTNIALKVSRLARLLNDFEQQAIMSYEAGGYPSKMTGLPPEVYRLGVIAGREFEDLSGKKSPPEKFIFTASIEELEQTIRSSEASLSAAIDPNVSISSANPSQFVWGNHSNFMERTTIRENLITAQKRLSNRRAYIHSYVVQKNLELKFSGIADDVFSRIRGRVDKTIGTKVPKAIQKLSAVYDNLRSENTEDWSNAVHSCRRILQDLADTVCPVREDLVKEVSGKRKTIKLGEDNYINRIMFFVENNVGNNRFSCIVGSHLEYIGERLDSIFAATQKGSHAEIVTKEEADRYVVYTYLLVGDILCLL